MAAATAQYHGRPETRPTASTRPVLDLRRYRPSRPRPQRERLSAPRSRTVRRRPTEHRTGDLVIVQVLQASADASGYRAKGLDRGPLHICRSMGGQSGVVIASFSCSVLHLNRQGQISHSAPVSMPQCSGHRRVPPPRQVPQELPHARRLISH